MCMMKIHYANDSASHMASFILVLRSNLEFEGQMMGDKGSRFRFGNSQDAKKFMDLKLSYPERAELFDATKNLIVDYLEVLGDPDENGEVAIKQHEVVGKVQDGWLNLDSDSAVVG